MLRSQILLVLSLTSAGSTVTCFVVCQEQGHRAKTLLSDTFMITGLSTEGVVLVGVVVPRCLELPRCSQPLQPDGETRGGRGKALPLCHLQLKLLCLALCCRDITAGRTSQVLPLSAEPQMFQGFTSVPMHHANRISSLCAFMAPAS